MVFVFELSEVLFAAAAPKEAQSRTACPRKHQVASKMSMQSMQMKHSALVALGHSFFQHSAFS